MRIPLASDLKSRTGFPDKDARIKNGYIETAPDGSTALRSRPAAHGGVTIGTGQAQGGIGLVLNGVPSLITFNGDTLATNTAVIGSLPGSPSVGQTAVIANFSTTTYSVSGISIPPDVAGTFYSDGYTWGAWFDNCSPIIKPSDRSVTTVTYSTSPITPLSNSSTMSILGYDPCGNELRVTDTKTYTYANLPGGCAYLPGGQNPGSTIYADYMLAVGSASADVVTFAVNFNFPNPVNFVPFNSYSYTGPGTWPGAGSSSVYDAGGGETGLLLECNIPGTTQYADWTGIPIPLYKQTLVESWTYSVVS